MAAQLAPPHQETSPEPDGGTEDDRFTVEDFFALIPEGMKADLIDGGIYVASPDTPRSDDLFGFLEFLLDGYVGERDLGKVHGSRVAFQVTDHNAPEPDVAFVAKEGLHRVGESRIQGGPDVAVEIVSRDSRRRDYVDKKRLYRDAGVREYWIIDPGRRRTEFHSLQNGEYALVPLVNNRIFRSQVMPGFWLDVEWLFVLPLPSKLQCLQQILAGEPAE